MAPVKFTVLENKCVPVHAKFAVRSKKACAIFPAVATTTQNAEHEAVGVEVARLLGIARRALVPPKEVPNPSSAPVASSEIPLVVSFAFEAPATAKPSMYALSHNAK